MQPDKGTYTPTGQILSQNFQENQRKMQKHIYYDQMIGWKSITLRKIQRYRDFVSHCGRSKVVVSVLRTFRRHNMGTITKFI